MKIYIKTSEGRRFIIPVPLWIIRAGLSKSLIKIAIKHTDGEDKKNLEQIDFGALSRELNGLKEYKGLKMVEIKSRTGEEIVIQV